MYKWEFMYSACQKFPTFNVVNFLWPPPPEGGGLTLNMVEYEISSLLEEDAEDLASSTTGHVQRNVIAFYM